MNENLVVEAKKILKSEIYTTVSSAGEDNVPWVTPLYFAVNDNYVFYWVSPKDSWHAKNIKHNSKLSWVCFDSHAPKWTGMGVYFTGKCEELTEEAEIKLGLTLIFNRLEEKVPEAEEYLGNNTYRVYKAVSDRVWITNDKTVDGKTVDGRSEIELK